MAGPKLRPLSEAERAELEAWLAQHGESLPEPVRAALAQHQALCEGLSGSRQKLSRVLLFPEGKRPEQPAAQRVAEVFQWCRLAADRGKKGYSFDWRIFGGREWQGHQKEPPTTRLCRKMPASLSVMGTAMREPHLDVQQQRELIETLRTTSEWDLDDPSVFYRGV